MSDTHLIPVLRLQTAIQLLVRGFGSQEAEVQAVSGNLIDANQIGRAHV